MPGRALRGGSGLPCGVRDVCPRSTPAAGPHSALSQLLLVMESLALPRRPGPAPPAAAALAAGLQSPKPVMKKQAVKRHHHKHNLRHRYEFLETLGKGTYGKVKKAREGSGRLVSAAPSRGAGRRAARAGRGARALLGEWPPSRRPHQLRSRGWGRWGRVLQMCLSMTARTVVVDLRTPTTPGSV